MRRACCALYIYFFSRGHLWSLMCCIIWGFIDLCVCLRRFSSFFVCVRVCAPFVQRYRSAVAAFGTTFLCCWHQCVWFFLRLKKEIILMSRSHRGFVVEPAEFRCSLFIPRCALSFIFNCFRDPFPRQSLVCFFFFFSPFCRRIVRLFRPHSLGTVKYCTHFCLVCTHFLRIPQFYIILILVVSCSYAACAPNCGSAVPFVIHFSFLLFVLPACSRSLQTRRCRFLAIPRFL